MSSINVPSEHCACSNPQPNIQFACNCGAPVVFLCNLCVLSHLIEPRSHTFLSLEQARSLLSSQSNSNYAKSFSKFLKLKAKIQDYQSSIKAFSSHISAYQAEKSTLFQITCQQKLKLLDCMSSEASTKIDEISRQMSLFDERGKDMLASYSRDGLNGLLSMYNNEFTVFQKDVEYAMLNAIYIGREAGLPQNASYEHSIKELYDSIQYYKNHNEELMEKLKICQEVIRKHEDEEKRQQLMAQRKQSEELKYADITERYKCTVEHNMLIKLDKEKDLFITYSLYPEAQSNMNGSSCCILPDGNIMIVGNSRYNHSGYYHHSNQPQIEICDTFKFNIKDHTCVSLNNLNSSRTESALCCNGEYLYAFGGIINHQISQSAERMKWDDNGWIKLTDIATETKIFMCYPYKQFILIAQNANYDIQIFDVNKNEYNSIPTQTSYGVSMIKEIDSLIYILSGLESGESCIVVLSDELEIIYKNRILNNKCLNCFNALRYGRIDSICYSFKDNCFSFYDNEGDSYEIIKQVKIYPIN